MSRTLAAELADRTLQVVNPQNRAIALEAALKRHGFAIASLPPDTALVERSAMIAWLLSVYSPRQ
jgi:hypothetical protein